MKRKTCLHICKFFQIREQTSSLNWDERQEDEVENIGTDKESVLFAMRRSSGLFSGGIASFIIDHSLSTNSLAHHVTVLWIP